MTFPSKGVDYKKIDECVEKLRTPISPEKVSENIKKMDFNKKEKSSGPKKQRWKTFRKTNDLFRKL